MKNKKAIFISILIALILLIIFLISIFIFNNNETRIYGVWWWNDELAQEYLDFAYENGINEIYYCSSKFNDETNEFIKCANEKGIKVFWLAGEYEWIENSSSLINKIEKYNIYQNNYKYKFSGIHLDIEPHQQPEFDKKRNELITKFIELCYNLKNNYANLYIEYDIPFWLDDEITFNNKTKPAYEFVIDYSSKVTVMSYRDTSEKIYDVAKEEIEYAKSINKTLNLSVETKSEEGDNVSFMEEGKEYMYSELNKLTKLLPDNFGIVIHQIYTWYNLKDRLTYQT